jgi:hypothetical protein
MNPETLSLLERRLARIRKEHVGQLLSLLNEAIGVIRIDRKASVSESLDLFKRGTAAAQSQYGTSVRTEVVSVVNQTQRELNSQGKQQLLALTSKYFSEELYMDRFRIYEESFARHIGRYGAKIDLADFRPDLVKSLYQVGSTNFVRTAMAQLADDLELIVQRPGPPATVVSTPVVAPDGKMQQANRLFKLEPNFLGIGINLNYLIQKWLGRKK